MLPRVRGRRVHCFFSILGEVSTSSARTSGTVICGSFFPQPPPLQREEPQGQQGQGGVVVPTHPTPGLVFVQPALPFRCLKTLLDGPVVPADLSKLLQGNLRRGV